MPASRSLCLALLAGCIGAPIHEERAYAPLAGRISPPEEAGILAFLSDPQTTVELLDYDVALDVRAAQGLIDHRNGRDGSYPSDDDVPFETIAEVDAIPYVGPVALERLRAWSTLNAWVPHGSDPAGSWEGVAFTWDEVTWTLDLVNTASLAELDEEAYLDRRAAVNILAARPLPSMSSLARVSYVGPHAMAQLQRHVRRLHPSWCVTADACADTHSCIGLELPGLPGRCVPLLSGEGHACSSDSDCDPGLLCAGLTHSASGQCIPNTLSQTFENEGMATIPDGYPGGTGASVTVFGMGPTIEDLIVRAAITHPDPSELVITLSTPHQQELVLWDQEAGTLPEAWTVSSDLNADSPANGRWTVRIRDVRAGSSGRRETIALWMTTPAQ